MIEEVNCNLRRQEVEAEMAASRVPCGKPWLPMLLALDYWMISKEDRDKYERLRWATADYASTGAGANK